MTRLDGAHVAILGWAGASKRQLRGIASFYEARGARVIAWEPRVFRAMAFPEGWSREGGDLARELTDAQRESPGPLVFHAFSNAGFWTLAAALRALARDAEGRRVRAKIAAAVIDSAPGFPERLEADFTSRYAAMAMMPIVLRALKRPPALSHPILDPPMRAFMRVWFHTGRKQIREAERSLDVVRDGGAWPLLFLYSRNDSLVRCEYVDAFIASLAAHGRAVTSLCFPDTEHVRHMIGHRRAYFDAIGEHLERALA